MRFTMRHVKFINVTITIVLLAGIFYGAGRVFATDGDPIMDLGIFSWIKYQQKQFFTDIVEIAIEGNTFSKTDVQVKIYQPIIFENRDKTNHRLVFLPGLENKMDYAYTSPVIKTGERWGLELHTFGVFPYQCTLHPEERGRFTVKL
jgi:plastocyanin